MNGAYCLCGLPHYENFGGFVMNNNQNRNQNNTQNENNNQNSNQNNKQNKNCR